MSQKVMWTITDEASSLATYSFLPMVKAFTKGTGADVETSDVPWPVRSSPTSRTI